MGKLIWNYENSFETMGTHSELWELIWNYGGLIWDYGGLIWNYGNSFGTMGD